MFDLYCNEINNAQNAKSNNGQPNNTLLNNAAQSTNKFNYATEPLRLNILNAYRMDEKESVEGLLQIMDNFAISSEQQESINSLATKLINNVRQTRVRGFGVDVLMQEFKLSTVEGVALMCLAESLLRIPDKYTQNQLIRDKVNDGDWYKYTKTDNTFVNAASWGLLLTGKLTKSTANKLTYKELSNALLKIIGSAGEPIIRRAMQVAVKIMGNQFVMSETIDGALKKAMDKEHSGYKFSYDMLGEAAMTEEDAGLYMQSYIDAIHAIGKGSAMSMANAIDASNTKDSGNTTNNVHTSAGVSVKLSAIHSRYQRAKYGRVMSELYPRVKELFLLAQKYQIGLFIDAEEAERLVISLDLFEKLVLDPDLKDFKGFGFVVQAYQKRAPFVVDYLVDLAKRANNRLMVRLVKGAYWDTEIKQAQIDGQDNYPVFTRKFYTDLCYLACAKKLLLHPAEIYPLFATHNAYTVANIYEMANSINNLSTKHEYEFQCLYGMGETLYNNIIGSNKLNIPCRIYAPVGTHKTLLAYLVRRLLENGANSSFVHLIVDKNIPIDQLLQNPIELAKMAHGASNPNVVLPRVIYPDGRINSKGLDLTDDLLLCKLQKQLNHQAQNTYLAHSLIDISDFPVSNSVASNSNTSIIEVLNPANKADKIGEVIYARLSDVDQALTTAQNAYTTWHIESVTHRASLLLKMADLMESESNYTELLALLVREAGKTLANAVNEIREAVDFCRYYANYAMTNFDNKTHKARGTFVCISPWNFPLAIFIGEISSALVTGNTVIAKPAEQTNLIAFLAIKLFYAAGVPTDVLQLVLGLGEVVGDALARDIRVKGVIFTGSTAVAQLINRNLAKKPFESVLIAETGGQNAMIVDSSALPEQVVADVVSSGFDSAGQRCSALRVLYLQEDIADKVLHMLKGAMQELQVGNPALLATDVGPVIDADAQQILLKHIEYIKPLAKMFYQTTIYNFETANNTGFFVPPTLVEINSIKDLPHEVFGPIVHVIRFAANELDNVIDEINSSGYGLTQGLHSRIEAHAAKVYNNIHAGNIYINRNMVGAVVGVQPFGGEGMSGTGPKAGGPLYLYRLVNTIIAPLSNLINTTAKDAKATPLPDLDQESQQSTIEINSVFTKLNDFMSNLISCAFSKDELLRLRDYANLVRKQTLLTKPMVLVGPTGERNFMFFVKRGVVALFATTKYEYAMQIIAAFATNNDIVMPLNINTQDFRGILPAGSSIGDVEDIFAMPELGTNPELGVKLNTAVIATSYANKPEVLHNLAKRDGALVTIVYQQADSTYPLYLLITERSVSIDITATGGNVELMSMSDEVLPL
jgi:RHH-type proline utilization regulon transcriptional repressor/proline dehydrogenase/delta 1-pyrroline-5-carboxylate dehydrogenase